MKSYMLGLLALLLITASCEKATDTTEPITPLPLVTEDSVSLHLVKTITRSGNMDSFIVTYAYTADGSLLGEKRRLVIQARTISSEDAYTRDAAHRIQLISTTDDQPVEGQTYYPTITYVHYEAALSNKISYTKRLVRTTSVATWDSTTYTYNTLEQVTKTTHYVYNFHDSLNRPQQPNIYFTWSYDSTGNLTIKREFSDYNHTGTYTEAAHFQFAYDDKPNPLFSHDAALLEKSWGGMASPNNCVEQANNYSGFSPDTNRTTYTYRADGWPASSIFTGNGSQQATLYYYQ